MREVINFIFSNMTGLRDYDKRVDKIRTIANLIGDSDSDRPMNLVPSDRKGGCYEMAVFISITHPIPNVKLRRDQFIKITDLLPVVIQQVLGSCFDINKRVAIIIDEIDTSAFSPWKDNLRVIRKRCKEFGIYYMRSDRMDDITDTML